MSPRNAEIDAYFSDPINFPLAFKQWLIAYLEVNPPYLIVNQLSQKGTLVRSPGFIDMWGGTTAPTGTVMCDGASYLRVDGIHDGLFLAIGTTYGAVDATHFNVPNIRDRVAIGAGGNTALGANDGIAAANRFNTRHRHTPHSHIVGRENVSLTPGATSYSIRGNNLTLDTSSALADGGSGVAADPLDGPAYVAINFVIWL